MPLPLISESRPLKRDDYFQMQSITTRDGRSLLAKFAICDLRGLEDSLLEHEYRVFESLRSNYCLTPVQLGSDGGRVTAYYANIAAVPLAEPGAKMSAAELAAALRDICAALSAVHAKGWVLAGLSPRSFLRERPTDRVVLADAAFAQPLGGQLRNDDLWSTSPYLAYAAPEVIGRAPLDVNERADEYSLGAVLYELACGRPPFNGGPAELIQSHLAKRPPALAQRGILIPEPAANLIMGLLAKSPEDRCASLSAFEYEMLRALRVMPSSQIRVRSKEGELTSLPPFSPKLYGLDEAKEVLLYKLRRTRAAPALVLLEGEPGVGKTSLLRVARELTTHGYFCRGRYVAGSPEPLSGWTAALRDLANFVLTRSSSEVDAWRAKVGHALGESAALITVLVPEWAVILSDVVPPDEQPLDDGLSRIALAIRSLLRCFAEADAPVVLAFDDLQWADSSSLRILELVLTMPEPVNLIVLAATRKVSSTPSSPCAASKLRTSLRGSAVEVDYVLLRGWGTLELQAFLHDTFGEQLERADAFAEVLLTRTQGNPFFVHQFLQTLATQRILLHDESAGWSWRAERIQELRAADDVVELLTAKLRGLSEDLKSLLRMAASLGASFSLADLVVVSALEEELALAQLDVAISHGLLAARSVPLDQQAWDVPKPAVVYEFSHDKVLEACRGLMSEDERARRALEVGRRLLAAHGGDVEAASPRIAGFFNQAPHLLTAERERLLGARLNLQAGISVKRSGAFSQALEHFRAALGFLGSEMPPNADRARLEAAWRGHGDLCATLMVEAAEAGLMCGEFALVYALCDEHAGRVTQLTQRSRVYEIRVCALAAEKRFPEAVTAGCEMLAELGIKFPKRPRAPHAAVAFLATKRRMLARPVERLRELELCEEPRVKAASRIMQAMYSAAYLGHPNLFPLLVCRHIDNSLRYGNQDYSCVTYIAFALVLSAMGHFDDALRVGGVALDLLRILRADRHAAKVLMGHYAFVFPWHQHLRDSIPHLARGIQAGLEHGDFEYAGHLLTLHSVAELHAGLPLQELAPRLELHRLKIASLRQERSILLQRLLCQAVHDLRAGGVGAVLSGPHYAADEMLPRCLSPLDQNLAFNHFLVQLMLGLYMDGKPAALEAAKQGRQFLASGGFGIYVGALFVFWDSLIHIWATRTSAPGRGLAWWRALRGRRQLAVWSRHAPMNFRHKYHLVEAELARARRQPDRAALHYERSIELAQAHGYSQDTALAAELAAEFYLERGMERLGRHYLREAHAALRRWGATAVMSRLERQYPQHFAIFASSAEVERGSAPSIHSVGNLDYRVLLTSFQTISAEMNVPKLLERLLRTMFEHAGAQRAVLILDREGVLYVEAEANVDHDKVAFLRNERLDDTERLPISLVSYVARTGSALALGHASRDDRFAGDPYVRARRPRSVLVCPMTYQGRLLGLAYLENNRVSHVFTQARLEVARLLSTQAAISIATARFHALELEAQQAKINPHFLFNALDSIAEVALRDGAMAERAVLQLAGIYRYVLVTSLEELVTLEQELETVRSYLELEKLRYGAKLEYDIHFDSAARSVKVPGLLIQPLVENAVRHGVSPKSGPGRVWIEATANEHRCTIVVQDDGDSGGHATFGTGFGLRSVQQRLSLVFGNQFTFAISRGGGYRTEITIPVAAPEVPLSSALPRRGKA